MMPTVCKKRFIMVHPKTKDANLFGRNVPLPIAESGRWPRRSIVGLTSKRRIFLSITIQLTNMLLRQCSARNHTDAWMLRTDVPSFGDLFVLCRVFNQLECSSNWVFTRRSARNIRTHLITPFVVVADLIGLLR